MLRYEMTLKPFHQYVHKYFRSDEIWERNLLDLATCTFEDCFSMRHMLLMIWHCMRLLLNNVFTNGIMDFKFAGEQHLRKSGVQSYVIIRPGQLIDGPLHYGSVCVGQTNEHFMSGMATTRADVADVCVAAATCDRCNNVTFECASTPAPGCSATPINADQLLGELSAEWDRVTFL